MLAAIRPAQVAYRGPDGFAVEVPQDVLTQPVAALPEGIYVLVRVHHTPQTPIAPRPTTAT